VIANGCATSTLLSPSLSGSFERRNKRHRNFALISLSVQSGGEIVGSVRTPQKETNYSVYMENILREKPDAIFMFQPAGAPSIGISHRGHAEALTIEI